MALRWGGTGFYGSNIYEAIWENNGGNNAKVGGQNYPTYPLLADSKTQAENGFDANLGTFASHPYAGDFIIHGVPGITWDKYQSIMSRQIDRAKIQILPVFANDSYFFAKAGPYPVHGAEPFDSPVYSQEFDANGTGFGNGTFHFCEALHNDAGASPVYVTGSNVMGGTLTTRPAWVEMANEPPLNYRSSRGYEVTEIGIVLVPAFEFHA